jgi:flavin-dependent dehydrogenase
MKRWIVAIACLALGLACADGAVVLESARDIPVAYDVDVVVIGGSTGAVAAAAQAAKDGAKVFLAAPRHYLGDDMCATYHLGLESGEVPKTELAKKIFTFSAPELAAKVKLGKNPIPLKYTADLPSASPHKDNRRRPMLTDGYYALATKQSVQYGRDVTLTLDLLKTQPVSGVHLVAFHRRGEFEVASIAVSISEDSKTWSKPVVVANKSLGKVLGDDTPIQLSAYLAGKVRYVRIVARKGSGCERILIGEIAVDGLVKTAAPAESKSEPKLEFNTPTPMHVKRTLDDALLDAGVKFLYGCYVTDVLIGADGKPAGIVMANRAGRQAVRAKVIIDATDRAIAARAAGAKFKPYPAGKQPFKRITFGGTASDKITTQAKKVGSVQRGRSSGNFYEYSLAIPMKDSSFASFAAADQTARNLTWHDGQLGGAELLFQVPPDPMTGRKSLTGDWAGAGKVDIAAFQPARVDRMYVLGGCADISRSAAGKLLRPVEMMAMGQRIGTVAATQAKGISAPAKFSEITVAGAKAVSPVSGEVREVLKGVRSMKQDLPAIHSKARGLPVIGKYDVVVIGGGTGGAPAGISSARKGAKTLVVEVLHGLGGVGTLGMIAKYYHGNRVGFSTEIDKAVGGGSWNVEKKMEWYRSQLVKSGADIWYGTLGCGMLVENNRITGVVVATHHGRGVVLAGTVIDATGNASMASAAGAECTVIDAEHISVQGTGLPPLEPGAGYTNTDWTFHDDDDVLDMWRMFVVAKAKYKTAFDLGQLIDTRARRRIVGDAVIMPMDIQNKRTFPDTVVVSKSNFDNHGFSSHTIFMIKPPDHAGLVANVPYRCLLPKGFDGILVTGLGISAHGDAMPVLRMQPDIQNQGYAAGLAAAMAAKDGTSVRKVDIKALQKQLVAKGNLPKSVLTDRDSYPMSSDKIAEAVKSVTSGYKGISVILAHPAAALGPLKKAYKQSDPGPEKIVYAHILGMLYDPAGAETLAGTIKTMKWDKGWNFRGMGQFGRTTSPVDNLIVALGRTGNTSGLDAILEKIGQLNAKSEFSHYRSVAMALEALGDRRGAKPLADLLKTPGVSGHAFLEIKDVRGRTPASRVDTTTRNNSLRELILARALYRCGDHKGLGEKILKQYAKDLRGHYSRHAQAVLAGKASSKRN